MAARRDPTISFAVTCDRERALIRAHTLSGSLTSSVARLAATEETTMSRHWHRVSKLIQKLAAGLYPITSEGMFPYEIHYVLATDEEIQRLSDSAAIQLGMQRRRSRAEGAF
jgi:hypothetical protein